MDMADASAKPIVKLAILIIKLKKRKSYAYLAGMDIIITRMIALAIIALNIAYLAMMDNLAIIIIAQMDLIKIKNQHFAMLAMKIVKPVMAQMKIVA